MNKQAIFPSDEKFHFFAKNSGRQKKAEEGAGGLQEIIALSLVLLVIAGVVLFFFNNDINQYFRNLLPTFQGNNQSSDEIIAGADDLIANACPIRVAEVYSKSGASANEAYYKINVSGKMIETDIYQGTQQNGIYEIKKKQMSYAVWFLFWEVTSGDILKFDTLLGKIGMDKVVLIDDKYFQDSGSGLVGVDKENYQQLFQFLTTINGSVSRGGILCKNISSSSK